jgi:hypothetical protein
MSKKRAPGLGALAAHLRVEVAFLEECARCGALSVQALPEDPRTAPAAELARLRRLQRLCRGLDLDPFAGSLIVELLERVDALERDLERLRGG